MFKLGSVVGGLALVAFCGSTHAAEWTAFNSVGNVLANNDGWYIESTTSGWGPASCPTTQYLLIVRTEPAARELLAVVLSAKANNRTLRAYGACHSTWPNSYFNTNYLNLQ